MILNRLNKHWKHCTPVLGRPQERDTRILTIY